MGARLTLLRVSGANHACVVVLCSVKKLGRMLVVFAVLGGKFLVLQILPQKNMMHGFISLTLLSNQNVFLKERRMTDKMPECDKPMTACFSFGSHQSCVRAQVLRSMHSAGPILKIFSWHAF
jgi:hypothetical protein